jgi:formiminoglutamase
MPAQGVHALQMELAFRGYMHEPAEPDSTSWPVPYDQARAARLRAVLTALLSTCLEFVTARN